MTREILRKSPMLAALDDAAIDDLAHFCHTIRGSKGYAFFEQGEPPTGVFWVGEGEVDLHMQVVGSETRLLRTAGPGDVFGELALVDGEGRAASARARGRVRVAFLHESAWRAMLAAGHRVAVHLVQVLNRQIDRRFREVLREVVRHPAPTLSRGPALAARPATEVLIPPPPIATALLAQIPAPAEGPSEPGWMGVGVPRAPSPLGSAALQALLADATLEGHPRGAVLALEGEQAREVYVVLRGALRTSVARHGRLAQILIAGPGSWVGVDAMSDRPRAASIDVREQAWILRVDAASALASAGPAGLAFGRACGLALARDLRVLNRHHSRLDTMLEPAGVTPCAG